MNPYESPQPDNKDIILAEIVEPDHITNADLIVGVAIISVVALVALALELA